MKDVGKNVAGAPTHTFMPAQKDWEDLWSQVYTMQLRTCLRFGAVSSGLVAFLMLTASSDSDLVVTHTSAHGSSRI